jgi:hypothetical protein
MAKRETPLWTVSAGGASPASTVKLLDHTWGHITDGHPEMAPLYEEIRDTIISPSAIYESATKPNDAVLFFNHNVLDAQGQALAVPVLVSKGIVTTACYRNINYSGVLLWKK